MTAHEPKLDERLERLLRYWEHQGAPIASRLRRGLSGDDIDAAMDELGLRLPPEARQWFAFADGAEAGSLYVECR